jgi:hypothetical protein
MSFLHVIGFFVTTFEAFLYLCTGKTLYRVLFFASYAQRLLWNSYLSNDSGVLKREVIGHNLKNLFPLWWWRLGLHPEWL